MIVNIDIKKLKSHPQNPRKDLGDLTELTESIKNKGILQNLTVVDNGDDTYTVIIGHRRTAAAKKAGLKTLPCVIAQMNEREQIATMLEENMQRSDLTVIEEAESMQLMLDLGETLESICQKTGFSQSTVRHRLEIAKLDRDKLHQKKKQQINITDYIRLEKIKDINERNKLLDMLGTNNFEWYYKNAINEQKKIDNKEKWYSLLETVAENIEGTQLQKDKHLKLERVFGEYTNKKPYFPESLDLNEKYYYEITDYGYAVIYKMRSEEEIEQFKSEKYEKKILSAKRDENSKKLEAIQKNIYECLNEFSKKYVGKKEDINIILPYFIAATCNSGYSGNRFFDYGFEGSSLNVKNLTKEMDFIIKNQPQRLFAQYVFGVLCNSVYLVKTFDWQCEYKKSEELNLMYELAEKLGYRISDEERAYAEGTHELYLKKDGD